MIHFPRGRFAALLLATSSIAFGQQLSTAEFDARRRELRGRFERATTPAEKERIHEEFRRLELQLAEGSGDGSSAGAERALAAARGSSTAGGASGRDAGLGVSGDTKPDPAARKLEALLAFTRWELSHEATPDVGTLASSRERAVDGTPLAETSRDTRRAYQELRQELRSWVETGQAELDAIRRTGKGTGAMSDRAIADWEFALAETGANRRFLAGWLARHHAGRIAAKRAELEGLRSSLARRRESLARIQKAMKDADDSKKAVQLLFDMKDVVEILENLTNVLEDVGHLPAAVIDRLYDKFVEDPVENRIAQAAGRIFDHAVEVELVSEGYEDLADVLRSIKNDVRSIDRAKGGLADMLDALEEARRREEAPRWK